MRQPHVWGGEPELLMASHVLRYVTIVCASITMMMMMMMMKNKMQHFFSVCESDKRLSRDIFAGCPSQFTCLSNDREGLYRLQSMAKSTGKRMKPLSQFYTTDPVITMHCSFLGSNTEGEKARIRYLLVWLYNLSRQLTM
jgi:hypothetical protein